MGEEGQLKAKIKADLKKRGAYWYMPVPYGYGKQSVDFLVCLDGLFIGIETKSPGKVATPRQLQTLAEITAAGGLAFWCDTFASYLEQMP